MLVVLTPSMRMLLELRLAPLTLKTSARDGFGGHRVRLRRRREAREHAEEVLVVTVDRHRQIHELGSTAARIAPRRDRSV